MIVCLQQDCLPVLDLETAWLPRHSVPTLTEVATIAIYGAPAKPDALAELFAVASRTAVCNASVSEAEINSRARRFYEHLSEQAVARKILLEGIRAYVVEDAPSWWSRPELSGDPETITNLRPLLMHDIVENAIDVDPPLHEDDIFSEVFDRKERKASETKTFWRDVRIPSFEHADLLLSLFAGAEAGRATEATEGAEASLSSDALSADEAIPQEADAGATREPAKRGRPRGSGAYDDEGAVAEMIRLLHGVLRDDEKRPNGMAPAARAVRHFADGYDRNSGEEVDKRIIRKYKVAMGLV